MVWSVVLLAIRRPNNRWLETTNPDVFDLDNYSVNEPCIVGGHTSSEKVSTDSISRCLMSE